VLLSLDLSNPADRQQWEIQRIPLAVAVQRAYRNLQVASPGVYLTAEATVAQFSQSSIARLFSDARQVFEQTARETTYDPNLPIRPTFHLNTASPPNWQDTAAAANFTAVTLNSTRMRLSEDSRFDRWSGSTSIWRFGVGASSSSEQYNLHAETTNMRISFKYAVVQVRRLSWYRGTC
jgi:hypothetical protein